MKRRIHSIVLRCAALLCVFGLWFAPAGTALADVSVSTAEGLSEELGKAGSAAVTITYGGVSPLVWDGALTIPGNVTLDLGTGGALLLTGGATFELGGRIIGAVDVASGTLVIGEGGGVTGALTASGGVVRRARSLALEGLDAGGGETILSIVYAGAAGTDASAFVTRPAGGVIYPLMNRDIERVVTSAGVYRLGTRNTETLSREYAVFYSGLGGAALASPNPASYTASDAAGTLNNPTREGFEFAGWTCAELSIDTPTLRAVIPEGTSGALTFAANWTARQAQAGIGKSGSGMSGAGTQDTAEASADTDDDGTANDAASAIESTQQSVRVGNGKSSTKVTFTSEMDTVPPTMESVSKRAFSWGWIALGIGGATVLAYLFAWLLRRKRERAGIVR